ncbi:MAG: spore coat associated protein CotJA [Clostridia bacterium]|nr:spore coat associated protein CotJA [Clostridia bacterium]
MSCGFDGSRRANGQGGDRRPNTCGELRGCSLAMVYSPFQQFEDIYDAAEGLSRGTIFKALDKPLVGNGRCGI